MKVFKHIKVINLTFQTNFGSNLIISIKSSLYFLQKWVAQYSLCPGLQTLNDNWVNQSNLRCDARHNTVCKKASSCVIAINEWAEGFCVHRCENIRKKKSELFVTAAKNHENVRSWDQIKHGCPQWHDGVVCCVYRYLMFQSCALWLYLITPEYSILIKCC